MQYDAIVVLAGGITDEGLVPESVKLRINRAQILLEQKKAPRIIFSGRWSWYRENHKPLRTEAAAMVEYAQSLGMPRRCLLKEEQSHDTWGNALFTKTDLLEPNNWHKVVVITSDFHAARASRVFKNILGDNYVVDCEAVKTAFPFTKRLRWRLAELYAWLLDANRFTQHSLKR
jgi:uncharacterized SAM-binding protein YcdF (DUF218 family)